MVPRIASAAGRGSGYNECEGGGSGPSGGGVGGGGGGSCGGDTRRWRRQGSTTAAAKSGEKKEEESRPASETVEPTAVFDVASLVLYGSRALPVRFKILLDQLFNQLFHAQVKKSLDAFGWTNEDYNRGYILQVSFTFFFFFVLAFYPVIFLLLSLLLYYCLFIPLIIGVS